MLRRRWKIVSAIRGGDWPSKFIAIAQIAVGLVALAGLVGMLTLHPFLLLGFTFLQGLAVLGVVLFAVAAIFAQRTMVLEEFEPGDVIFREGDRGHDVYVIKSGSVEVLRRRPDGGEEVVKRLAAGDHFGEMALIRKAPRNATVRAVSALEVLKVPPSNFVALYTNLPGFRDHFNKLVESRVRELEGVE